MDCRGNKNENTKHRKHAPEDRGPQASLPGPIHPSTMETPSDMERIAVDCLIEAKSVRKDATELGVHCQNLTDAMGQMRCAALPVTLCERAPRLKEKRRARENKLARVALFSLSSLLQSLRAV